MPHIEPRPRAEVEQLPDAQLVLEHVESLMGFVPNSLLTMAHRPRVLRAFAELVFAVRESAEVDPLLMQLVAHVASTAAGCRYCQAHTASTAARRGVPHDKLSAVWDFEHAEVFTPPERAALRLARDAALVPNAATAAHFDELSEYFDQAEMVDLVAMISLFGFLNRWNDTVATALEDEPLAVAETSLAAGGWQPGKHAPAPASDSRPGRTGDART